MMPARPVIGKILHRRGRSAGQRTSRDLAPTSAVESLSKWNIQGLDSAQVESKSSTTPGCRASSGANFQAGTSLRPKDHPAFKALYPNTSSYFSLHQHARSEDIQASIHANDSRRLKPKENVAPPIFRPRMQGRQLNEHRTQRLLQPDKATFPGCPSYELTSSSEVEPRGEIQQARLQGHPLPGAPRLAHRIEAKLQNESCPPQRSPVKARRHTIGAPILSYDGRPRTLARKSNYGNLRDASEDDRWRRHSMPINQAASISTAPLLNRAHLNKPLPPIPCDASEKPIQLRTAHRPAESTSTKGLQRPQPWSASGRLHHDVATTLHEQWEPAVTHETVTRRVHEVREHQIFPQVHNHHVHHRTQPVVDLELLPARHFVPVDGGYAEVNEYDLPSHARPTAEWLRAETMAKLYPKREGRSPVNNNEAPTLEGVERNFDGNARHRPPMRT